MISFFDNKRQKRLDEVTRKNLVGKTKYQSKARWEKRKNYSVDTKYSIDVNKFINEDIIAIIAHVGDYECTVAFEGVIQETLDIVQSRAHNNLTQQDVYKALYRCIDKGDIYVDCTCPDYCLHEDTEIKLLNGEVCTIKDVKSKFDNGEELYVYSTDENGDFKPGKVNDVWVSGYTNDMIKITLDNGKEIVTTPNHRYMLRNGEYEEAQNLKVGTSLSNNIHTIKKIEYIHYDLKIPVYDMEVDKYNNFYVDAGVVLHNCYRFKYWASRLGYQYGKAERRPAHITNGKNSLGSFCKHLTKLLADKSWTKRCAVVVTYIMKDNLEEIRDVFGLEEDELTSYDTKLNLKQYRVQNQNQVNKSDTANQEEPTETEEEPVEDINTPVDPNAPIENEPNEENGEEPQEDINAPVMN